MCGKLRLMEDRRDRRKYLREYHARNREREKVYRDDPERHEARLAKARDWKLKHPMARLAKAKGGKLNLPSLKSLLRAPRLCVACKNKLDQKSDWAIKDQIDKLTGWKKYTPLPWMLRVLELYLNGARIYQVCGPCLFIAAWQYQTRQIPGRKDFGNKWNVVYWDLLTLKQLKRSIQHEHRTKNDQRYASDPGRRDPEITER